MGLDKFRNRDDVKWAHPELEMSYQMMAQSVGYSEVLLNEDLPLEQRKEYAEHCEDGFKQFLPDYDWSRTTEYEAPGCADEPDAPAVKLLVAQPKGKRRFRRNSPCILIIPGGALAVCLRFTAQIESWADRFGVPCATLKYRTIPEGAQFPAPLNDCEAAYNFLVEHAEELNISPNKIVIHGNSSGGHLSLALPHRLKKHGITCRGSVVWAPIIDDRPMYYSSKVESVFWGNGSAALSARQYLGDLCGSSHVPPEAMPGRATPEECVGLSPVFIHAMTEDTGLSAALHYCDTLSHAGVYNECHAWGGTNHLALSMNSLYGDLDNDESDYTKAFQAVLDHEFEDLFRSDLRRPWVTDMVEGTEADAE